MVTNPSQRTAQHAAIAEACVLENPSPCREHRRLVLHIEDFPTARPGQFIHLIAPDLPAAPKVVEWKEDEYTPVPAPDDPMTVRRAFSIAGLRADGRASRLDLIYRVVGRATTWMSRLGPGDRVNVLGPLGNAFQIAPEKKLALLVAGGVGLPPMLWWSQHLAQRSIETVVFVGARTRELLPLRVQLAEPSSSPSSATGFTAAEFNDHGAQLMLATDDGSLGRQGLVTDALYDYVKRRVPDPAGVCVYTCGPETMMKNVALRCQAWNMDCEVCLERSMACGMGTCQSCVVAARDSKSDDGWSYKLCCTEGPVFNGRNILWD